MDYTNKKVQQAADAVQSFMTTSKTLEKFIQQNAASLDLTVSKIELLHIIYSYPGITLKEIAERTFSLISIISITIDGLVNLGLVERKLSEEDCRKVNFTLTDKGEELSKISWDNALCYMAMCAAFGNISEEDAQSLLQIHKENYWSPFGNTSLMQVPTLIFGGFC